MAYKEKCLKFLDTRTLWLAILVPVILLPLPILSPTKVAKCGYCVIVIGIFWVTEVIPLAVTSLLPVVLFPLFGIMSAKETCTSYAKDTLMLFMGSLIVAVAVERWNLHRRVALRTLCLVGPQPKWLMFGIMFPCWFLSMWMSNTATAAMMMPIVNAVIEQIRLSRHPEHSPEKLVILDNLENGGGPDGDAPDPEIDMSDNEEPDVLEGGKAIIEKMKRDGDEDFIRMAKTFSLCIAFAANVGGMATLTGTPPNIIFKGQADLMFEKEGESVVNFANWLAVGVPVAVILFLITWAWLYVYTVRTKLSGHMGHHRHCSLHLHILDIRSDQRTRARPSLPKFCLTLSYSWWYHNSNKVVQTYVHIFDVYFTVLYVARALKCCSEKESYEAVRAVIHREANKLGRMTFPEVIVLINFLLLALLWMTRQPGFVPGWGDLLPKGFAGDSTPAILIGVLLFILPSRPLYCCRKGDEQTSYKPILNWTVVNEKMAWGVLLLMGGGFAVADACEKSGLSRWVSSKLLSLGYLDPWVIALVLSILISLATQVTSNSATATLFLPIVGDMAVSMGLNPLYYMIPCALSTSLAFILPVATPPNAIVFASGYLEVKDMMKAGTPINVMSLVVVAIALNGWFVPFYKLDIMPSIYDNVTESTNIASALMFNSTQVP